MIDQYDTIQHRWFEEVWNKGRADVMDELLDQSVIIHGLADPGGREVRGAEAFKSFYESFRGALPDIQVIVEDTVSEGDKVVTRLTVKARHTGEGLGLSATGNTVEFTGMCMTIAKDGKIVECWNSFDFLTMMQQIGLIKPPGQ
jgi:steroid delta-isomerase-like uncharacterized protein